MSSEGKSIAAQMRDAGWYEAANGLWYLPDGPGKWVHFALHGSDAQREFFAAKRAAASGGGGQSDG